MKIKFCPSPVGYIDLITVQLNQSFGIEFWLLPFYCWTWEWSYMYSLINTCGYIETPTMTIKFGKPRAKVKHED